MKNNKTRTLGQLVASIDGIITDLEQHIQTERHNLAEERRSAGALGELLVDTSTADALDSAFDLLEKARTILDDLTV